MESKTKCGLVDGGKIVSRLDRHLKEVHKLAVNTPQFTEAKSLATPVFVEKPKVSQPTVTEPKEHQLCAFLFDDFKEKYVSRFGELCPSLDDSKSKKAVFCSAFAGLRSASRCQHDGLCALSMSTPECVDEWFRECMKSKQPGSVRAYKCALKDFFAYTAAFELNGHPRVVGMIKSRIDQLDTYNAILQKRCRERSFDKAVEDQQFLLTVEELRQLDESAYVQTTVDDLLSLEKDSYLNFVSAGGGGGGETADSEDESWPPVTPPNLQTARGAIKARDVLITALFLRSLQRPGAFIGMTVHNVRAAQRLQNGTGPVFSISVSTHKTYSTHAHARFVDRK